MVCMYQYNMLRGMLKTKFNNTIIQYYNKVRKYENTQK